MECRKTPLYIRPRKGEEAAGVSCASVCTEQRCLQPGSSSQCASSWELEEPGSCVGFTLCPCYFRQPPAHPRLQHSTQKLLVHPPRPQQQGALAPVSASTGPPCAGASWYSQRHTQGLFLTRLRNSAPVERETQHLFDSLHRFLHRTLAQSGLFLTIVGLLSAFWLLSRARRGSVCPL